MKGHVCMHPKSLESCPTLCDTMKYSSPGPSVHEILYVRILDWVAMPSSRGSSQLRDWMSPALVGRFFTTSATWEDARNKLCQNNLYLILVRIIDYSSLYYTVNHCYLLHIYFFLILKSLILTCVPKHEPPSHLPPHNISLGHPHAPAPSMLYPASDIDWRFNSYMIVYMFQCHSPKSSHPLPLPLSPKVRYTHLCLFCCLAYRVVIAIFLNSIYMC